MKIPIAPFAIALVVAVRSDAAAIYTVTDLGGAGRFAIGAQINNRGHVIFGLRSDPQTESSTLFFFDGNSTIDLTDKFDRGTGLNDAGTSVGVRLISGTDAEIFRYTPPGLGGPPDGLIRDIDGASANVVGLNNEEVFVGWYDSLSSPRSFLSTGPDQFTDLGTLGGATTLAQAINDLGQVVGISATGATRAELEAGAASEEAFLYQNGQMIGLGTLGGGVSVARAINERGQVVGDSSLSNWQSHAFLYDAGGGMRDIGPTGINSVANDINDFGVVAGQQYDPLGVLPKKAFLYDDVNGIRFLDDLLGSATNWTSFLTATGINNSGQIVGTGLIGGETHIFLLTPVPEPGPSAINFAAFALLKGFRNRRDN